MGGKQSKDITTNDIESSIQTTISNYNKNVTDILNTQITSSTMELVNENAQAIAATTGGGNTLTLGNLNVSGSGKFSIDQKVDVKATNQAVSNITQDASAMSNLASQLSSDVMNKLQNDSSLQQSLQSASDLSKATSTAGGLNDMVGKVFDTIGSVMTPGSTMTTESETTIRNTVMTNLQNTNINENKIQSVVESYINNTIKQLNSASCNISTVANNTLTVGDVTIDENGQVSLSQVSNVNALNSCVLGAAQTTKMVSEITSGNETTTSNDTSNTTAVAQSMAAQTVATDTTVTNDAFGNMISSIASSFLTGYMAMILIPIGLCCCCILIVFLVFMFRPRSSGDSSGDSGGDSSGDSGGDSGDSSE